MKRPRERKTDRRILIPCLAILLLIAAGHVGAQTTTGVILGTVKDASGGLVPGAKVVVTNLGTNYARSVSTDNAGQYAARELPVGAYQVEVSAGGFKVFVQQGITLEVNRNARVDVVLEIGTQTEMVNVVSDAPLVETASVTLGRTVAQDEILNLPLVNRNVYGLLSLTAGVDGTSSGSNYGMTAQTTYINGSSYAGSAAVNYYLDGGSNVNGLTNVGNSAPNPDAIQEFRVVTNSFSAEYGRFAGGAVDVLTKSGTNVFHGSAFEYKRDGDWNADRWSPTATSLAKEPLKRDQFGATLGGPLKRDKAFFFVSYSGLRQETTTTKNTAVVPTALERAGDFSQSAKKPNDPLTKQPFPNDIIPAGRLDTAALAIMKEWIPNANLPNNFYEVQATIPTDSDEAQLKLDYALTPKHQLTASYFFAKRSTTSKLGGTLPWTEQEVSSKQHNVNLSDNWLISPAAINTLRVTYVRNFGGRLNTPEKSLGEFGSKFTIQGRPVLPNVSVSGYFSLQTGIDGPKAGSNLYQLRDVLTLAKGRHSVRVGGEASLEKFVHDTSLNNYGSFSFNGQKSGNALADYLLGLPQSMNQDAPITKYDNDWYFSVFAQDDFRVHQRLTLNLGLRYDLQLPPTDPFDRKLTFIQGRQSTVVPTALPGLLFPGDEGIPRGIVPTDWNNVSPRVGLAWDPAGDGRTAVRAAFGIFYGSVSGNEWNQTADNQPFTTRQSFPNVYSLSDPYRNLAGGVSPYPYVYDPASPRFLTPAQVHGMSQDFVWPYTYQMNLSVQRELVKSLSVNVAYVGALGRKLPIAPDLNQPVYLPGATTSNVDSRRPILPGTYARIKSVQSIGHTDYHGLQVTAEKRGRLFTAKAYYAFGKSLEDADLQESTVPGVTSNYQNSNNLAAERARTDRDRRHNFVLSAIWKTEYFGNSPRLVRWALRGWTLSTIVTLRSGQGMTITTGTDTNLDGNNTDRPNLVGDPKLSRDRSRDELIAAWFNTAAFTPAAAGQDGDASRNFLDGPGSRNVDIGLFRDFKLKGDVTLQIRAEATNALNIVNLSNPGTNRNAPATFGKINGAGDMRELQLGMRLSF